MAWPRTVILLLFATLAACAYALPSSHLDRRTGLIPHVNASVITLSTEEGAYPRVTGLSDGSLLASFTHEVNGTKTLTVVRSTDGGQTFSAFGTIAQSTGDLDNTFLLQLANGDVVATFRNHDLDANGNPTYYRITACISHDGGQTWSFLSQVNERAATATNNGLWEPFMRLSKADGSLQVYYSSENSATDQDVLLQSSTNNGLTWSTPPVTVAGATTTGRDGMPGCANFNDGAEKLMCVFETTEGRTGGTFSVKSVVSTDEGNTWGTLRSQVYAPDDGAAGNAGAPQLVATPDGNLVVSFMTDEDSAVHAWPNNYVSFKIVTGPPVATGSWGQKTTVTGVQSSWPGLYTKSDGSVLGCISQGLACHDITFTPN